MGVTYLLLNMEEGNTCLPKKHPIAKLVCGILAFLVLLAVIVVAAKGVSGKRDEDRIASNIKGAECHTEACLTNEERIGYLIDNTVAPCDDFFQYACSSKKRGKEFPYARKDVTLNLTDLIVKASGDFSFLRDFYKSCVSVSDQFSTEEVTQYCLNDNVCDKEELTKFGNIYQQFRERIQYFAGAALWPVLTDDWESKSTYFNFTWQKWSEDILSQEYFLGAFQYVKDNNGTPTEHFFSNVFFAPMIDHSVKVNVLIYNWKMEKQYTSNIHIIPMTFPEFLMESRSEDLVKYKHIMMSAMKLLGAKNETIVEEDMSKVIENEQKLAKLSKYEYYYDIYDIEGGNCVEVSLDEMNRLFPSCEWISYVNN